MKLTTPQIIMLNHAATVRQQRLDARTKKRKENGTETLEDQINSEPSEFDVFEGKRIEEMNSEEYARYMRGL